MNNDPSSSAAADLPPDTADSEDTNATRPIAPAQDQRTPAQKRLQAQSQKKNNLLKHLLENLDSIIYMELCILYYMEYVTIFCFVKHILYILSSTLYSYSHVLTRLTATPSSAFSFAQ